MSFHYIFSHNSKHTSLRHILMAGTKLFVYISLLELIAIISNFLEIFSLENTLTDFFKYFEKTARKSKSKDRILEGWAFSFL